MKTIRSAAMILWMAGCADRNVLGPIEARDGGADGATTLRAPLLCGMPGGEVGRHEDVVTLSPARNLVHDKPSSVGTGRWLTVGRAVVADGAIYWGIGDADCGRDGNRMWWGARPARIMFEPDGRIPINWVCLANTYRAYKVDALRVGDQLGLFYVTHFESRGRDSSTDYGYQVGTLSRPPMRFESTHDTLDVRFVATGAFGGDAHVLYVDHGGTRWYRRLDGSLLEAGDAVPVDAPPLPIAGHPSPPVPWSDAMLTFWPVTEESTLQTRAEVFRPDGSVVDAWSVGERVGLPSEATVVHDVRSVDRGVVALVAVGAGASNRTYFARFCEDGRWSMRRVGSASGTGALINHDGRWSIVTLALDTTSDTVVRILEVDDGGRRLGPVLVVDRGRRVELGDLSGIPSTHDVVVLYVKQPASNDPWQLRATRVRLAE